MATTQNDAYNTITLPSGADYTAVANQFKFVKISAGTVVLAGLGEEAIGVLLNRPNTGEAAQVQTGGIAKVQADVALATTGTKVMSSADGQAAVAVAAASRNVLGRTVTTAAAAGELVEILLCPPTILA